MTGADGATGPAGPVWLVLPIAQANRTFTNLGAGPTESSSTDRVLADLTGKTNVRVFAHITVAFVTGNLKVQYSTDGTNFSDLTTGLQSQTSTGLKTSASAAIPAGAKALVILRMVGYGGNGTEDPAVNGVALEVK